MNYNTHDYTLPILLEDEQEYFRDLVGLKEGQFISGGQFVEIVGNKVLPIRGNSYPFNYVELSHVVYLTKRHFNRLIK